MQNSVMVASVTVASVAMIAVSGNAPRVLTLCTGMVAQRVWTVLVVVSVTIPMVFASASRVSLESVVRSKLP